MIYAIRQFGSRKTLVEFCSRDDLTEAAYAVQASGVSHQVVDQGAAENWVLDGKEHETGLYVEDGEVRYAEAEAFSRVREHTVAGVVSMPTVMTAAMINAWSGGTTVTTDEVAYHTSFQDAWKRVIAACHVDPPSTDHSELINELRVYASDWRARAMSIEVIRKAIDALECRVSNDSTRKSEYPENGNDRIQGSRGHSLHSHAV